MISATEKKRVAIIGGGFTGLTAAYELSKQKVRSVVLEADSTVGGLARTAEYKGYLFDIGGHRFFTKVALVENMWREILGDDFITRSRLSRIYYRSQFFSYPLEPMNALKGLGIVESVRCGLSYLRARLWQQTPEDTFDVWVRNRFGKRLFDIFFKAYTEKVWGIPCNQIRAEWAAQRIRGLSLFSLVMNAILPKRKSTKGKVIKTLIEEFQYPRRGPGMMWSKTKDILAQRGSAVVFNAPVERIEWTPGCIRAVHAGGRKYEGEQFVSSMPIRDLIRCLDPAPPEYLQQAVNDFNYRDFLTVCLIVEGNNLFPDNWIYVHEPQVKVGRIQNFNNWSLEMVPDPKTTCLGLEYFCTEGDDLWSMNEEELVALGKKEVGQLGLIQGHKIVDGCVVRALKAYPVYDDCYKRGLDAVQEFLKLVPNLQLVGRNGMHRYNNQDHSMLTAIMAARNILGANYDLWKVNVDAEYHEQGEAITEEQIQEMHASQPRVPRRMTAAGR